MITSEELVSLVAKLSARLNYDCPAVIDELSVLVAADPDLLYSFAVHGCALMVGLEEEKHLSKQ